MALCRPTRASSLRSAVLVELLLELLPGYRWLSGYCDKIVVFMRRSPPLRPHKGRSVAVVLLVVGAQPYVFVLATPHIEALLDVFVEREAVLRWELPTCKLAVGDYLASEFYSLAMILVLLSHSPGHDAGQLLLETVFLGAAFQSAS